MGVIIKLGRIPTGASSGRGEIYKAPAGGADPKPQTERHSIRPVDITDQDTSQTPNEYRDSNNTAGWGRNL